MLNEKSSFQINDRNIPVIIRDPRGKLFYSTEPMIPKVEKFNLPKGMYFIDSGNFNKKERFEIWPLPALPSPERDVGIDPKTFEIIIGFTPHKCVINWRRGDIIFDNKLTEKSIPAIDFIINHEYAHRFYITEKFCDLYAAVKMLIDGYNPTQTGIAHTDALSDKAYNRMLYVWSKLKPLQNGQNKLF